MTDKAINPEDIEIFVEKHNAFLKNGVHDLFFWRFTCRQRKNYCEIFLNYTGLFCPCCGIRVRTRPRNAKYKKDLKPSVQET